MDKGSHLASLSTYPSGDVDMTLAVVHWNVRTNIGSEHVAIVKDDGNNLAVDRVRVVRARTYIRTQSVKSEPDGDPRFMIVPTLF